MPLRSSSRPLAALLAAAALALGLLGGPRDVAAQTRIAVVQVQYVVEQTDDGQRARFTLKKLFDKWQQDLDTRQAELQKTSEDIEKQRRVLSIEAFQKRIEDLQRRAMDLERSRYKYNNDLQKKQNELMAPISKKLFSVIARIAKKQGYDLIFDKAAAPYARADLDLTDQVIQLYNSGGEPAGGDAPSEGKPEEPKAPEDPK